MAGMVVEVIEEATVLLVAGAVRMVGMVAVARSAAAMAATST